MKSPYRLFDTLQDVVLVIDRESRLFYTNNMGSMLLAVSAKRLASGKALENYIMFSNTLVEGQSFPIEEPSQYRELSFRTHDGKEGWTQVSLQVDPRSQTEDPTTTRWIVFFRDVSLEKNLALKYQAELEEKESVIHELESARNQLEDYSKNLVKMVAARTAELREANQLLAAILDSLGQGIVVFNQNGDCLPYASKMAGEIFSQSPQGAYADLLRLNRTQAEAMHNWIDATFKEMLPFEDIVGLGPNKVEFRKDRTISLTYHPMRTVGGELRGIVAVATDQTNEVAAKDDAARERIFAQMILRMSSHAPQFRAFAADARRILNLIREMLSSPSMASGDDMARYVHTLKGGAGSFGLTNVATLSHQLEEYSLQVFKVNGEAPTFQELKKIGRMVNEISYELELILAKYSKVFSGHLDPNERYAELPASLLFYWSQRLNTESSMVDLGQQIWTNYLLKPISDGFMYLNDTLSSLALELGKQIGPLEFINGELKVYPEYYQSVFASFIHVFRNAIDHGLESPEQRIENGKSAHGQITLGFTEYTRGSERMLRIEIRDDGRGIDPEVIRERLKRLKLFDVASFSDVDVIQSIFLDHFSTSHTITNVSGRGIGLAATKAEVEKCHGHILVKSDAGRGSTFVIELPLIDQEAFRAKAKSAKSA